MGCQATSKMPGRAAPHSEHIFPRLVPVPRTPDKRSPAKPTAGQPSHPRPRMPRRPGSHGRALPRAIRQRRPGSDPAALVPASWAAARQAIEQYISAGLSKFVVRPAASPPSLEDFLSDVARELMPLQT